MLGRQLDFEPESITSLGTKFGIGIELNVY